MNNDDSLYEWKKKLARSLFEGKLTKPEIDALNEMNFPWLLYLECEECGVKYQEYCCHHSYCYCFDQKE